MPPSRPELKREALPLSKGGVPRSTERRVSFRTHPGSCSEIRSELDTTEANRRTRTQGREVLS